MRLKLLVVAIPLVLATGGCVVHFPLADNSPSLATQDESPAVNGSTTEAPTGQDTRSPGGAAASTPETPEQP